MKTPSKLYLFYKLNKEPILFALKFLGIFIGLSIFFNVFRVVIYAVWTDFLTIRFSEWIFYLLKPFETILMGTSIKDSDIGVTIGKGCDGQEGIILLSAALFAYPMGIPAKLKGILYGILVIYFANIFRIVVLSYFMRYRPDYFDVVHVYFGQIFIIVIVMVYFLLWIKKQPFQQQPIP